MKLMQNFNEENKQNSIFLGKKENVYEIKQDYSNFHDNLSSSNSYLVLKNNNDKMIKENLNNSDFFNDRYEKSNRATTENEVSDSSFNLPTINFSSRKFSDTLSSSSNFNYYSSELKNKNNLPEIRSDFNQLKLNFKETNPYNSTENCTPKQSFIYHHSSIGYYKRNHIQISPSSVNSIPKTLIIPNEKDLYNEFRLTKYIQMLSKNENPIPNYNIKKSKSQIVHLRKKFQNSIPTEISEANNLNLRDNKMNIKNVTEEKDEKTNEYNYLNQNVQNETNNRQAILNKTGQKFKYQIQHLIKSEQNQNKTCKNSIIRNLKNIEKNQEKKQIITPIIENSIPNTIPVASQSFYLNRKNNYLKSEENPYGQMKNFSTLSSMQEESNRKPSNEKWNVLKNSKINPQNTINSNEDNKIIQKKIVSFNNQSVNSQVNSEPCFGKRNIKIENKYIQNNQVLKEDKSISTEIENSENSSKASIITFGDN